MVRVSGPLFIVPVVLTVVRVVTTPNRGISPMAVKPILKIF